MATVSPTRGFFGPNLAAAMKSRASQTPSSFVCSRFCQRDFQAPVPMKTAAKPDAFKAARPAIFFPVTMLTPDFRIASISASTIRWSSRYEGMP